MISLCKFWTARSRVSLNHFRQPHAPHHCRIFPLCWSKCLLITGRLVVLSSWTKELGESCASPSIRRSCVIAHITQLSKGTIKESLRGKFRMYKSSIWIVSRRVSISFLFVSSFIHLICWEKFYQKCLKHQHYLYLKAISIFISFFSHPICAIINQTGKQTSLRRIVCET